MSEKTNEVLKEEYGRLVAQYGDLTYSRDQLEARILALRTRLDNLAASGSFCLEIEKRSTASQQATPASPVHQTAKRCNVCDKPGCTDLHCNDPACYNPEHAERVQKAQEDNHDEAATA